MQLQLIPAPQSVKIRKGFLSLKGPVRVYVDARAKESNLPSATRLADIIRNELGISCLVDASDHGASAAGTRIYLKHAASSKAEGYDLTVGAQGIEIRGKGSPGLFYGIKTLVQLLRARRARLPYVAIKDEPDFSRRGYYLDISRGKVPKISTIKRLIDRLAALKYNQFQLYVEHVFDFKFDPEIGAGFGSISSEDVLVLDAYCRERHIDFIPSLACFGHMGRVLSMKRYRALAEVEWPAEDWQHAKWAQRLHGATIDPRSAKAKKLLSKMLDEFLPLFSSDRVNVCGDETYDLGRGKNAKLASRIGIENLYVEHMHFLERAARKHGKSIMFWGDMMLKYPKAIKKLPRKAIALDWGYEPTTPFKKVEHFTKAGLEAMVCPSTRGYQVVFNQVEEARGNMTGYAKAGIKAGVSGVLVTDWGDMGHFNLLACSMHGMAVGSNVSWNARSEVGAAFDKAFSLQYFGDRTGKIGRLYSQAGKCDVGSWPYFIDEFSSVDQPKGQLRKAERMLDKVTTWQKTLHSLNATHLSSKSDLNELGLAVEAIRLNGEKIRAVSSLRSSGARSLPALRKRLERLGTGYADFAVEYEKAWLATNRPQGSDEVLRAVRHIGKQARSLSRRKAL